MRRPVVFVRVACATLILLFAGAAIGYWIYQHNRREVANNNSANTPNSKQSPGNVSSFTYTRDNKGKIISMTVNNQNGSSYTIVYDYLCGSGDDSK